MAKKELSRQRLWQLRQVKQGKCARCGESPLRTKNHCAKCAKLQREAMRKTTGAVRRYKGTLSYVAK